MTYQVTIDINRDVWATSSPLADVTSRVENLSWNAGMTQPYDEVAPEAKLTLVLNNSDNALSQGGTPAVNCLLNSGFDDWTAAVLDDWTVSAGGGSAVTEVGPGESYGGTGTGECNLYNIATIRQAIADAPGLFEFTIAIDTIQSGSLRVRTGSVPVDRKTWYFSTPGVKRIRDYCAAGDVIKLGFVESGPVLNCTLASVTAQRLAADSDGMLAKGTLVRVYDNAANQLYEGKIDSVKPDIGEFGNRRVVVTCRDAMLELLEAEYAPSLLENSTVDVALDELFDKAVIAWPYSHSFWMLGVDGCSELDSSTKLYGHSLTDFAAGSRALAYIGDNMERGRGVSAQNFIRELVATEFGGRFFWEPRTSKFVFHSRLRDTETTTVDSTWTTAEFTRVEAAYAADVYNDITIEIEPREIGAVGGLLWEATGLPILIKPGETKEFEARFVNPDTEDSPCGAKDLISPVRVTDILINRKADGSGSNYTAYAAVSLEQSGGSAKIKVTNSYRLFGYITKLQLRGTPILRLPRVKANAKDGNSIRDNGRQPKDYFVNLLDEQEYAQQAADWLLSKFKNPAVNYKQVEMKLSDVSPRLAAALATKTGHRITITDTWSSHDADYFVVGENHQITGGGDNVHVITWILKPASRDEYWLLGVTGRSELGTTTKLAF